MKTQENFKVNNSFNYNTKGNFIKTFHSNKTKQIPFDNSKEYEIL